MRFDGKDYMLTSLGHERLRSGVNALGERVLSHARRAPLSSGLSSVIASLLEEYDIAPEVLESDVREFIRACISGGWLAEPGWFPILGMDLSITNACNATCVYCPTPRRDDSRRFLRLAEVDRLIDDLSEPGYREEFGTLTTLEVGGLAEPLLHPDALAILGRFKSRYPVDYVILYTNATALTPGISQALIDEGLITSLVVSVDGLDDREHRASKGISYDLVRSHVESFLRARDAANAACRVIINVLPYARYRSLVWRHLGRAPLNDTSPDPTLEDRTDAIIRSWEPRLGRGDRIRDASHFFQLRGEYRAETDRPLSTPTTLSCPWFDYVAHSLSVTSNGDVLICCNDFEKEGILGNYLTTSLHEIARGPRRDFIEALARDDRERLSIRCLQRAYCQVLSPPSNGDQDDLQR